MRLSQYPYVVVRLACTKCPRAGRYRLARLADKYGSEAEMSSVRIMLSADCKLRSADVRGSTSAGPITRTWRTGRRGRPTTGRR